jgi:hypothetical protein
MNVYGGAYMAEKREALGKVVQMLLQTKEKATTGMAASQLNVSEPLNAGFCGVRFPLNGCGGRI